MKKLFLLFLLASTTITAQDIIIKKDGEEILSKVIEVDQDKIRYKRYDNPDGPIYSIAPPEVFIIKYANGTKDIITSVENKPIPVSVERYNIAGQWKNALITGENIQISREALGYYVVLNDTKARLNEVEPNLYAMEGTAFRLKAIAEDTIYLKDAEQDGGHSLELIRVTQQVPEQITEVARKESLIGAGISTGFGASYGWGGINAELRIGPRDFCLRPNVGLGIYDPTLDNGSMPIVIGAKLYFGGAYIGYRYGYLGTVYYEDYNYDPWTGSYDYYADYYEVNGSVLILGYDYHFGKRDQFYFTSGFGINISSYDLEFNDANFDLGFGIRI